MKKYILDIITLDLKVLVSVTVLGHETKGSLSS